MIRQAIFLGIILGISASSIVKKGSHKKLSYWEQRERVSGEHKHEVIVAVKQHNLDALERALLDVSTPGSQQFRKHWTRSKVIDMTMGDGSNARSVIDWLVNEVGATITASTKASEYIHAQAPIATWEETLDCNFFWFNREASERANDAARVARCGSDYALPMAVIEVVEAIHSVSNLPPRVVYHARMTGEVDGTIGNDITPAVLDSFYNIDSNTGSAAASQAVFETSSQTFSPSDLATFQANYGLTVQPVTTDVGGHSNDFLCNIVANECTEANLDVQYMMAVSTTNAMTYYYVSSASDPFLAFAEALVAMDEPILVNSISYGSVEADNTASTMDAMNTEAMKLGLLGGSIFVSSGDDGVTNYATSSESDCGYNPSYPATCPYVTAVGATYASSWETPGEGEIVCQSNVHNGIITSGGGFSAEFAAPNYTTSAIAGYFNAVDTNPMEGYAVGGRGYPDVSLSGFSYEVVIGGSTYAVCGTSCSSPAVAGMASLVNAIRLEAGASSIGFINPALYASSGSFANDITSGENNCVADDEFCCDQGFYAAVGWDPTTGFGSVDYAQFEALLTADIDETDVAAAKNRLSDARV